MDGNTRSRRNPDIATRSASGTTQSSGQGAMRARGVFWSDWNRRAVGENRSLPRAGLMARELGIQEPQAPILTVVASKGKGTTATYASAYLLAAGMHTVTVTSPGLRGVRDRIRYDGRAIPDQQLTHLAERVNEALGRLPKHVPGIGYLSPSGLFIIAGVLYAEVMKANAIVLEAGMGGASDEVSLFQPTIVAITEIFGEHLGVLGDTPVEIAADKASVATAITKAVISLPQNDDVAEALRGTVT